MKILQSFGRAVTQAREIDATSLSELARRAGINKSVLWKIEAGESDPQLTTILKIASALNVAAGLLVMRAKA